VAGATDSTPNASEEETVLAQAEDAMARQDFAQARRLFRAALEKNGTLQARALYGLALVATQERQPELARSYFERTLEVSKDPHLLAWSHIYLGRIYDMKQERELAVEHYRQALETQDAEAATRRAAELGLEAPFRRDTLREQGGDSGKKNGSC
jgi:tetratricopeptide (TPR) repeat protein